MDRGDLSLPGHGAGKTAESETQTLDVMVARTMITLMKQVLDETLWAQGVVEARGMGVDIPAAHVTLSGTVREVRLPSDPNYTILHCAAKFGTPEVVRRLVNDHGCGPLLARRTTAAVVGGSKQVGNSPFDELFDRDREDVVSDLGPSDLLEMMRTFVEVGGSDLVRAVHPGDGATPFLAAISYASAPRPVDTSAEARRHQESADAALPLLFELGGRRVADLRHVMASGGHTLMHCAIIAGNLGAVRYLMQHGARDDVVRENASGVRACDQLWGMGDSVHGEQMPAARGMKQIYHYLRSEGFPPRGGCADVVAFARRLLRPMPGQRGTEAWDAEMRQQMMEHPRCYHCLKSLGPVKEEVGDSWVVPPVSTCSACLTARFCSETCFEDDRELHEGSGECAKLRRRRGREEGPAAASPPRQQTPEERRGGEGGGRGDRGDRGDRGGRGGDDVLARIMQAKWAASVQRDDHRQENGGILPSRAGRLFTAGTSTTTPPTAAGPAPAGFYTYKPSGSMAPWSATDYSDLIQNPRLADHPAYTVEKFFEGCDWNPHEGPGWPGVYSDRDRVLGIAEAPAGDVSGPFGSWKEAWEDFLPVSEREGRPFVMTFVTRLPFGTTARGFERVIRFYLEETDHGREVNLRGGIGFTGVRVHGVPNAGRCHRCLSPTSKMKSGKMAACCGCRSVSYCSKECQALDWKRGGHNKDCRLRTDWVRGGGAPVPKGTVWVGEVILSVGGKKDACMAEDTWATTADSNHYVEWKGVKLAWQRSYVLDDDRDNLPTALGRKKPKRAKVGGKLTSDALGVAFVRWSR